MFVDNSLNVGIANDLTPYHYIHITPNLYTHPYKPTHSGVLHCRSANQGPISIQGIDKGRDDDQSSGNARRDLCPDRERAGLARGDWAV